MTTTAVLLVSFVRAQSLHLPYHHPLHPASGLQAAAAGSYQSAFTSAEIQRLGWPAACSRITVSSSPPIAETAFDE